MATACNSLFASTRQKLSDSNVIESITVKDIRFETSKDAHGSDAMHKDPDYSAAYVITKVAGVAHEGHGITFSLGRGNEIITTAVKSLKGLVEGCVARDIFCDFASFWKKLTCDSQLRWIGPEKGATHLAVAGIVNSLWDLWAKIEEKPVWKLLSSMSPKEIVSLVDFTYMTDVLTPKEAEMILESKLETRSEREAQIMSEGYTAYTTSAGWLGYSDERIRSLCRSALEEGFDNFKVKIGQDVDDDIRRCAIIREEIGPDRKLMTDANQRWEVAQAIEWMKKLVKFKPIWIEEPTSPDDILGHLEISKSLASDNIGVATGECCQNRVLFKQFIKTGALQYCQVDSARLGGINENIAVILMAAKYGIPVCPHAGGVGLCEMVQHLSFFDFVCVSGSKNGRIIEYVDHLHEHFVNPVVMKRGCYMPPLKPGYSTEMKAESLYSQEYPNGSAWSNSQRTENNS